MANVIEDRDVIHQLYIERVHLGDDIYAEFTTWSAPSVFTQASVSGGDAVATTLRPTSHRRDSVLFAA